METLIVVEALRYVGDTLDISDGSAWGYALDQRAFGPRRFMVLTARLDGIALGLAHCDKTEPPELALACCLDHLHDGAATAVAFSDEPVSGDAPPPDLRERFHAARGVAHLCGVHLVDWILCDDHQFRSMRYSLDPETDWWDVADPCA